MSLLKFRSKASAEFSMLKAHAEMLLHLIGKEVGERGLIQTHELSNAHHQLTQAIERDKARHERDVEPDPMDINEHTAAELNNRVTLAQRAWPLLHMIEEAQKHNADVHWGF